jgi:hypothetical protein
MNSFPLLLSDISLWLAATGFILLITSELLLSSPHWSMRLLIDKGRLRLAALGCGLGFMIAVVMYFV